jgi:hypothetical protein
MGSRPGFYKSGKRNKELTRQRKQEEKKLRRLNKTLFKGQEASEDALEAPVSDGEAPSPSE